MNVGIIGLGLVGTAMARRLLAAGHAVTGYDIASAARDSARGLGVSVCGGAVDVAASCRFLFLCLLASEDRRELLWGPQNLATTLRPDTVLLDVSTGRPADLVADHTRLAPAAVRLVDVCLAGSSAVIARGEAIALIGDRAESATRYRDLLATFSKAQYYFDTPGRGCQMKLIANTVFGLNRLVLAESLGLAARAGFDLPTVLDVLRAGDTYSACMDTKGPKMIARDYEPPAARLAQHAKDVALILELARACGARTPVSELHARLIREAVEQGAGDWDNAAIFEIFRKET